MNAPRGTLRYWVNLIGFTLVALIVGYIACAYIGVSYFIAQGFKHPTPIALCCETPADWGLAYEGVALKTDDNLIIDGWYLPSRNGAAAIQLHSVAANPLGARDLALMFAQYGYGVLMIDLQAHGESEGDILIYGGNEYQDVSAGVDYLHRKDRVTELFALLNAVRMISPRLLSLIDETSSSSTQGTPSSNQFFAVNSGKCLILDCVLLVEFDKYDRCSVFRK